MDKLFLLGGVDLEMSAIRNILIRHEERFFDKDLKWGDAYLSRYTEVLERYSSESDKYIIYGVELIEDIDTPENYIRVDHHNDFSYKRSSIEQVAEIIGYKLDRYEQLVAINDSFYIDGMIKAGATKYDIDKIRRCDRQIQGVTQAQELIAESELEKNIYNAGDLIIVHTSLSSFSPITDRLYPFKKLIIYNDTELVYYGQQKDILTARFKEQIDLGKMYHGGGDNGFIGTSDETLSTEQIIELIETIKNIVLP